MARREAAKGYGEVRRWLERVQAGEDKLAEAQRLRLGFTSGSSCGSRHSGARGRRVHGESARGATAGDGQQHLQQARLEGWTETMRGGAARRGALARGHPRPRPWLR